MDEDSLGIGTLVDSSLICVEVTKTSTKKDDYTNVPTAFTLSFAWHKLRVKHGVGVL